MWPLALTFAMRIIPAIPGLVGSIEGLFRGKKKAGAQKWIAVETVLAPHIADLAQALAVEAPPGTKLEEISRHVSIYTRAVNDATVAFANALHMFPTGDQPAIAAPPPAK
jgi:hypothetical protein